VTGDELGGLEKGLVWHGSEPGAPAEGDAWYDMRGAQVKVYLDKEWKTIGWAEQMRATEKAARKFGEAVQKAGTAAAAAAQAQGYEMTRALLRPHDARMRDGWWVCLRCDAMSGDPDIIREVDCRE